MALLKKIYRWFHKLISPEGENDDPSAGYWSGQVRRNAFRLCKDIKGRLLEVGCGEGLFLAQFDPADKDLECYGIDHKENMLKRAKNRFRQDHPLIFGGDGRALPFKDSYFDAVVYVNVALNLPSDESFYDLLNEAIRVCKKGGSIIFDIRNALSPFVYAQHKLAKYYDETVWRNPFRAYRLRSVKKYLTAHDLELARSIAVGGIYGVFAPIFLLSVRKKGT